MLRGADLLILFSFLFFHFGFISCHDMTKKKRGWGKVGGGGKPKRALMTVGQSLTGIY